MRLPFCVGWRGGWVQLYDHMYFLCSVLLCCFSYCYYSNFALFLFCFFFHLLIIGSGVHLKYIPQYTSIHLVFTFSAQWCQKGEPVQLSTDLQLIYIEDNLQLCTAFPVVAVATLSNVGQVSLWMIQTKVGFHCLLYGVVESTVARHITIHKWKWIGHAL